MISSKDDRCFLWAPKARLCNLWLAYIFWPCVSRSSFLLAPLCIECSSSIMLDMHITSVNYFLASTSLSLPLPLFFMFLFFRCLSTSAMFLAYGSTSLGSCGNKSKIHLIRELMRWIIPFPFLFIYAPTPLNRTRSYFALNRESSISKIEQSRCTFVASKKKRCWSEFDGILKFIKLR